MELRLKIVLLLYDASTTFNVAVQYLQCKHLGKFARSRVRIIHENSFFLSTTMKSWPAYYMRVCTQDVTVCTIMQNFTPIGSNVAEISGTGQRHSKLSTVVHVPCYIWWVIIVDNVSGSKATSSSYYYYDYYYYYYSIIYLVRHTDLHHGYKMTRIKYPNQLSCC